MLMINDDDFSEYDDHYNLGRNVESVSAIMMIMMAMAMKKIIFMMS